MSIVGTICVVLLAITGVLCIVRIVRGPTMLDRTVAADVFVAASAGAIGIEAAVERHNTTLSILFVLALVGFLSSVSIARFAAPDTDRRAYDTEPTDPDDGAPDPTRHTRPDPVEPDHTEPRHTEEGAP